MSHKTVMNSTFSVCVIKNFCRDFSETKYAHGKGKIYQSGYGSGTMRARPGSFCATEHQKNGFLAISRFWFVSFKPFVPFSFKYILYSRNRS